jgi:hypothetical protein
MWPLAAVISKDGFLVTVGMAGGELFRAAPHFTQSQLKLAGVPNLFCALCRKGSGLEVPLLNLLFADSGFTEHVLSWCSISPIRALIRTRHNIGSHPSFEPPVANSKCDATNQQTDSLALRREQSAFEKCLLLNPQWRWRDRRSRAPERENE